MGMQDPWDTCYCTSEVLFNITLLLVAVLSVSWWVEGFFWWIETELIKHFEYYWHVPCCVLYFQIPMHLRWFLSLPERPPFDSALPIALGLFLFRNYWVPHTSRNKWVNGKSFFWDPVTSIFHFLALCKAVGNTVDMINDLGWLGSVVELYNGFLHHPLSIRIPWWPCVARGSDAYWPVVMPRGWVWMGQQRGMRREMCSALCVTSVRCDLQPI